MIPEQSEQLIQSVVDFTGAHTDKARRLLEQSEWSIPEAVTKFFTEVEAIHARTNNQPIQPISGGLLAFIQAILNSFKSCFGWTMHSCWNACKLFLFGSTQIRAGSGNLSTYFSSIPGITPSCLECTFQEATAIARARDNRKVLLLFLHSSQANDFDYSVRNVLCEETVALIINSQFPFWAADTSCTQPHQLLQMLPITTTPLLLAVISVNSTEIKIVAASGGAAFSIEGVMSVLQKAQEEQDRLMAEDEQFKINRTLREDQDREYQEALRLDKELEEQRIREEEILAEKEIKMGMKQERKTFRREENQKAKLEVFERLKSSEGVVDACTIVVRLPGGVRIERKFERSDKVAVMYDWVFCCGLLHEPAVAVAKKIYRDNFVLSTSFPSVKIEDKEKTFIEMGLVPNAVLAFTLTDDEDTSDVEH